MTRTRVVLIGGPPGAGKTSLGRAVAARIDGTTLSVDDLFSAAFAVTTRDSHPGLHCLSKPVTGMSAAEYFTTAPVTQLLADANDQHAAIWPAVEHVIRKRASTHREPPVVIDGWHLRPESVLNMGIENVIPFWLVVDRSVLEERERGENFFRQSADPGKMLSNFLARSYWYNDLIETEAERLNFNIIRQDGSASVEELCEKVMSQLRVK